LQFGVVHFAISINSRLLIKPKSLPADPTH
jgi:hypothetical protein